MKKLALLVAAIALTLSACGSSPDSASNNAEHANAAITAAETANSRAKKVNYEWRDTGKIIKKAQKALKEESFDMAVKLANKAKRQAENAYKQYLEQRDAKPNLG
jgi:starvation-inducible outer membrane lipoprotein